MLLQMLAATAMAVKAVSAFADSSPFLMYSIAHLPHQGTKHLGNQIATTNAIEEYLTEVLTISPETKCSSQAYIFVDQPNVAPRDLNERYTPHMYHRMMKGQTLDANGNLASLPFMMLRPIANVVGDWSKNGKLEKTLQQECGATEVVLDGSELPKTISTPAVITIKFSSPPNAPNERRDAFMKNDAFLDEVIASLPVHSNWTVMHRTTPASASSLEESVHAIDCHTNAREKQQYEMEEPMSSLHTDLKRDLSAYPGASNSTGANLPLFETYQFLNSAIFMGITVMLLLVVILYVALSAISGLEVSYMAFSKEMNPSTQKKQQ